MSVHNFSYYTPGATSAKNLEYGTYDPSEALDQQKTRNETQQTKYMFGDPNNPGGGMSQHDMFSQQQQHDAQANQLQLAKMPLDYQQNRFNTLFPYLTSQMGQGNAAYSVGGQSGAGPQISAAPIWNGNQIQQQVNSARATNDQTMATRTRASQASLAGRGFGANSPLAQAMAAQFGMQNLVQNQNADRDIRWNAAQGNSEQVLKGQQAQEQQYSNRQGEDIERRKTFASTHNALLGALAGLM